MSPNPQETTDLVTCNEEILNGKLHFLRGEDSKYCLRADHFKNRQFTHKKFLLRKIIRYKFRLQAKLRKIY